MFRTVLSRVSLRTLMLWGAVFAISVILPSSWTDVFASPDETAVAVSLQQIEQAGSAAVPEALAISLPWLHPRSYVPSHDALVPVGFLGWPWWLAQLARVLSLKPLAVVASLLAASGVIPWYLLLRKRFGSVAAWWGTALAWTFPSVVLYLNRSLFSHIPQLTGVFWALWILVWQASHVSSSHTKKHLHQVAAGLLLGVGLSFRPIEAIWLVPMFLVLWTELVKGIVWKKQSMVGLGVLLGVLPLLVVQAQTYGSWFQIGYWVSANVDPSAVLIPQLTVQDARPWYEAFAPYGLHPRTVWWNVRRFFLSFLLPWVIAGMLAAVFIVPRRVRSIMAAPLRRLMRKHWLTLLVLGFFFGWILLIYGSGLYLDHVRSGAVTVGNSFLRYTLPFGFVLAWFLAWVRSLVPDTYLRVRTVYALMGVALMVLGLYCALWRDEESVLATRRELVRYQVIRAAATQVFQSQDILLSERSDKIFFPVMRVASPLPNEQQIKSLAEHASSSTIGLFARPLSLRERDAWRRMGYDVSEVGVFGRERLYRLIPFLR